MRKSYFFLASAALVLASCTDNILPESNVSEIASGSQTIDFNLKTSPLTRATLSGKSAAEVLNSEFVVYGTKHTAAETATSDNDAIAFQNYKVTWTDNTAGTSTSNSSNWEYVGVSPYAKTLVSPVASSQTIKYWDESATEGYTFTAFAGKKILDNNNSGSEASPVIQKITTTTATGATVYDKGYTVNIPADASLDDIYFSDRVEVPKTSYGNPVTLTFRNFGSRVRVGFYETVPGYSVKIDKFYVDNRATKNGPVTKYSEMGSEETSKFSAALQNVNASAEGGNTVTVTYGDGTNGIETNQVKVNSGSSANYQYTLTLGTGILSATSLAKSSAEPTWDTEKGAYTTVYPNLDNTKPMLIRCDYTLTADDGSGETIKVKNARVVVPVQYCQWKSNYAYTYLFKISDKTNGTTGSVTDPDTPSGDKEGLFPITFDAVAITATQDNQETITTLATNSVTTYSKTSEVTKNDEYKAGEDIYFVNESTTGEHSVLAVAGTTANTAKNAVIYSIGNTPYSEAEIFAQLTGSTVKDLTLTQVTEGVSQEQKVPSASGTDLDFGKNGALKFTPSAAGYYAYVYCTTKYDATEYTKLTDTDSYDTTGATVYYLNANEGIESTTPVYYVASGIKDEATFNALKSNLYKVSKAGTAGAYDIKVVKVAQ